MNTYLINIKSKHGYGETIRFRTKIEAPTSEKAAALGGAEFREEFPHCSIDTITIDRISQ